MYPSCSDAFAGKKTDFIQPKPSAYPSDSASTKTSSPSSPVPDSEVVDKLPVEVVTIGTDWEACSEASAEVLSVNTDTGNREGWGGERTKCKPNLSKKMTFSLPITPNAIIKKKKAKIWKVEMCVICLYY